MAKKFNRLLSAVLSVIMCMSCFAFYGFADEAITSTPDNSPKYSTTINKTNNGLDINDQTDVTLSVPGEAEGNIDVVFILGGGMTANMKTIESAIEVFRPVMESGKSTVRMGLISLEKGKEIILDLNSDEAVLDPATYIDFVTEKFDSINDLPYGTTNLHSQLLEAQKMLDKETKADAENKYIFVLATGRTYWFDDANGEQATIVNKLNGTYYWGNYLWQSQRGRHTSLYMLPDRYNNSYEAFFADIEKWVADDGDKYVYTPHFDVNDYSAYVTWEQNNNKDLKALGVASSRYGNGIVNPKPTNANAITGIMAGASADTHPSDALNYERAQYECVQVWKELVAEGYRCYSICSENPNYQNGSEYIKLGAKYTGTSTTQVGHAFMDYLAKLAGQEYAPTVWDYERDSEGNFLTATPVLQENFFDTVKEDILYYCSIGSKVEDFIGYDPEKGNFEFIDNPDFVTMTVGDVEYITTEVETKEGYDFSLAFTAPGADEPTFWFDYTYGNGTTTEKFIWTFGENVSRFNPASLTYKLQLIDKCKDYGEHIVDTNISATLYPVDSNGKEIEPEKFPVPYVEYANVSVVITKVDDNGKALAGAEFELYSVSAEKEESLGTFAVDANGKLTIDNLPTGSYKLVETKAPAGYAGIEEPMYFNIVMSEDGKNAEIKHTFGEFELYFPSTAYEISNSISVLSGNVIPQTFVLLDKEKADNWTFSDEFVFGESDFNVVYCGDSNVGAENGTEYIKYTLEDCFDTVTAGKLRAIIANSYPYVSVEEMIDVLVAAGVADAENLSRGDIIAAVQLAIWHYTNDVEDYSYKATYSVMDYPRWGKVFHDYSDELPAHLPNGTTKTVVDNEINARIRALYNYLVDLESVTAAESEINAFYYIAVGGKSVSQSLIGANRTNLYTNGLNIYVKNFEEQSYDVDIVLALGAGIAQYDADSTKGTNTYDSIVSLVEPLVNKGINVKLGLVAVEHYDDVAMELTVLTKDNYKEIITAGLDAIQKMPAGPTNLHSNIVAAKNMLDADTSVPAENKFFHVIATGRTYNYDNTDGVPTTIINKVALKGSTYYYWGHYLWQSQRGGHTSLYMIPARYNNSFDAYWADVCKWVEADGDKYAYSFTDAYDVTDPQWFTTFYAANSSDAKAMGLASSRFGWILKGLTNSGLDAIGSGSNPANALNYERAQYEAWKAYTAMKDAGYNCYALCSESTSYQNGSPYIKIAKYTGTSTIQLGHSFMNFLNGGEAPILFVMTDPNTGASKMAENFYTPIDLDKLVKSEKPAIKGPVMMSPAPKNPIVITSQPEDVVAEIGERAAVTVAATGEGLTYQWFYKNKNASSFAVSSIKSKTYAVSMTEYCHMREVYCVITDANGNTVTTDTAVITRPAVKLAITVQPEDVVAAIGERAAVTVSATGDGLTYQWFYKNKNATSFSASSIKGKTYAISMTEYCHMREVYCVITDANGNTVTTDTAVITRPAVKLAITVQPENVVAAIGERAAVTVAAAGDGLTYQWFYKNKNATSFAVSSVKSKTYAVTMAEYCHMREVYCVITDANGNTVTTDTVVISRPAIELAISAQPQDVVAAIGERAAVTVTATGDDLTYQWFYKNKNATSFSASSIKSKTYAVTMASYCDMRQVYCVITDANGNTVTTDTVTIIKAK